MATRRGSVPVAVFEKREVSGRAGLMVPWLDLTTFGKRHLAIVGNAGHVATFDWQTGAIHAELQLQETCRDITYVTLAMACPVLNDC